MLQKLPVPALLVILELTSAGYATAGGRGGPRPVPPVILSAVVDPGWPCGLGAPAAGSGPLCALVCEIVHRQAPGIAFPTIGSSDRLPRAPRDLNFYKGLDE